MDVSIASAKNKLTELIRTAEGAEKVVITRHGKPVAQIVPATPPPAKIRWGGMQKRIVLHPGWDDSVSIEEMFNR